MSRRDRALCRSILTLLRCPERSCAHLHLGESGTMLFVPVSHHGVKRGTYRDFIAGGQLVLQQLSVINDGEREICIGKERCAAMIKLRGCYCNANHCGKLCLAIAVLFLGKLIGFNFINVSI